MSPSIKLPAQWKDVICTEGEQAYPNECCGVLLGRITGDDARDVENILPISNAREEEERYHRFQIHAEDIMAAEKAARSQGRETLGFYHSHPDHPARPSEYDQNNALPFYSYIILEVEKGKVVGLTSWRLGGDRKEFLEETVQEEN